MRSVRKALLLVLCVLVTGCLIAAPSGCGSPGGEKSDRFLEKADGFLDRMDSGFDGLTGDIESLMQSVRQGSALTSALIDEISGSLRSRARSAMNEVLVARDAVSAELSGEGLTGAAELGRIREEMLENASDLTGTLAGIFGQLSLTSTALAGGGTPDTGEATRQATDWTESLERIREKSRQLLLRARALKRGQSTGD
jgi:hypothetical protein